MSEVDAARYLTPPNVWCDTCAYEHIPFIPATTFRCHDCGFGAWVPAIALAHAEFYIDHDVYPIVHRITPTTGGDAVAGT